MKIRARKILSPITIGKHCWFYINQRSLHLIYEIYRNGEWLRTDSIIIPFSTFEDFLTTPKKEGM